MIWKNSNPRPLRYRCNALPTELSKLHESGRVRVQSVHPVQSLKFFQVIFLVVLWLHSYLSFFHYLIATVGHLLPWNSCTWAEYHVHWTYRAELTHDRSHVALIAQLVEHCTGNAKVVGSNPVQSLNLFQVIFPVVLWLHSHLSFSHLIATAGHLLPWD